jgi:uncharacterized repeat protein (TIGR01451 family)
MKNIFPCASVCREIPLRGAGLGFLCVLALCCLPVGIARAALSQPIVQQFFVPLPEQDLQTSMNTIDSTGTKVGNTMKVTIAIVVGQTNTVIVYDQWEDGYENDLNNSTQPGTKIWGDGNLNTPAPGYPSNILPAGAVILLTNIVTLPRNPSVTNYDGRDRIGATKPVVMTRAAWGVTPGTVLVSASEIYDTSHWGTNFMLPIGTNVNAAIQNFSYSAAYIMAAQNGTVVQIDLDGDGVFEQTNTLSMGQNLVVPNVRAGTQISSSQPVQVHEVTGRIGSTYQSRSFAIRPFNVWNSSYHAAAGTTLASEVHNIFLFNPYKTNITVQYQTSAGSGSFVVTNSGSDYKFPMPLNSGANFFTTNGTIFYAVGANDSGAAATANQTHDWGYALQPDSALTTVALCGWSPGSDSTIAPPAPDANGSPVWATPMKSTTIYVNYTGNPTNGPLTAPNGQKYNTNYTATALNYVRIYNPTTKNMTGARIFTTDGTLFTTVWGEDSSVAGPGNPYLDCGLTVLPFPTPTISKSSALYVDKSGNGVPSVGDTLQYTINVANQNTIAISDVLVKDVLPTNLTYVANSTTIGGSALADNSVPPALTQFPLDENGIIIPTIPAGNTVQIQFLAVINAPGTITNSVNGATGDGLWTGVASTANPVIASNSPAPSCGLTFSDSSGNPVSSYAPNAGIYVTVTNNALNLSSGATDTVQVLVMNDSNGDFEYLTLVETGVNTGIFRNTSPLPSSTTSGVNQQDGTLYAQAGQTLEVDLANSSCNVAHATVTTPSAIKQLYLDFGQTLDRNNPVALNETTTTNTSLLSAWKYSRKITIDHTKVGSGTTDEANFPILISLTSDTGLSTHALTSGNDILFTASDGVTVLSYERESYSSGTLVAWVKVPTLSHTTDTVLYMYYGNSSASDQQNKTAVWDSNYQGVWHLGQTPSSTKPDMLDSTSGANNGSSQGSPLPAQAAGQIDGSLTLSSNNLNYISTANSFAPGTNSSETVQAWIKTTTGASNKVVGFETSQLQSGTTDSSQADRQIYLQAGGKVRFGTWNITTGVANMAISTSAVNDGTWHSLVGVRDNTTSKLYLYVDGVLQATTNSTMGQAYTAGYWRIGSYHISAGQWFGNDGYFNGSVDEVRVSQIARSTDWVATEYNNESSPSTFSSVGTETALNNSASFVQTPAFTNTFLLPAGGAVTITNYISTNMGTLSASPAVSAVLSYGPGLTNFINFSSATFLTSGSGSNYLVWSGTLSSNVTVASGQAITFAVTNNTTAGGFVINYDSATCPSVISLPTTTIINVDSLALYTTPWSGTNLAGAGTLSGQTLYIRATVSDPFGAYDVNHLNLNITDPSNNVSNVTLTEAQVVATNGASKTYEYAWFAPATTGSYTFRVDAFEGTEGITNSSLASIYVGTQDLGVPSTTIFTYGPGGFQTNSYWAGTNISVQVTSLDANTNATTVDKITAVITTSTGDTETILLTETGPNTGIFTNSIPSSTGTVVAGDSTLEVQPGTLLNVTYTNPYNPADVSSATATIKPTTPGNPSVSVFKTLVSPAGGLVQTNGTVQFNIQVLNSGGTTLSSVILTDTNNNTQLAFTGASATPTSTNVVGNTVSLAWNNLGPLAVGASTNVTVNFTVLATGTFSNSAIVTGDASAGPSRAFVTGINTSLVIAKSIVSPVPGPAYIGGNVVFFIGLTNNGSTTITNLPLEDDYSAGQLQFVSASVPPAGAGGGVILWTNLGPLASSAHTNVQVTFNAVGAASPTVNSVAVNYAQDANGNPVPPVQASTNLNIVGASLSGNVWFDANANAVNDAGDSELSGVIVFLDLNHDGIRESSEPFVTTDANGNYTFNSLAAGTYSVTVDTNSLPAGVKPTFDTDGISTPNTISVSLTGSQVVTGQNFGYTGTGSIGNYVWYDVNGDGVAQANEPPLAGVRVFIDANGNGSWDAGEVYQYTTAAGYYDFTNLVAGTYNIAVDYSTLPAGVICTGDPDATKDGATTTLLAAGQNVTTDDFGFRGNASVAGGVFVDVNGNGVVDPGDTTGIAGVTVTLQTTGGATIASTITSAGGTYSFTNLLPGSYVVVETNLPGWISTLDTAPPNDSRIPVTLTSGQASVGNYFYDTQLAQITGSVKLDVNGNGIADPADTGGVSPVVLKIYQGGTNLVATVTNISDGSFSVSGLPPSGYTVVQTVPPGYTNTTPTTVSVTLNSGSSGTANYLDTPTFSIGNRVFLDNGAGVGTANNGVQDGAEPGIAGVLLKLYAANGSGNPTGSVLAQTNTDANGYYRFDGLFAGTYVVVVDMIGSGAVLNGMVTSTGWSTNLTTAGDLKDHGIDTQMNAFTVLPGGIASVPVQVGIGLQPLGEITSGLGAGTNGPGGDASDNLVVDFGFYSPPPTAATLAWLGAYVDTNGEVQVTWQTLSEFDLLYFDVLRTAASSSVTTDVTPDWVDAQGGQSSGYLYQVPDPTAILPGKYTYYLVGMNNDMTTNVLATATVNLTTNNAGVIRITGIQPQTNGMQVQWVGGQPPYTLESQTSPGASWIPVGPAQPGETEAVVPATNASGFFRVKGNGNE